MRITSKCQVTIPQAVRERAGLLPGTEVEFQVGDDGVVRLRRCGAQRENKALAQAVVRLRGSAPTTLSTDEIIALMRG